MISHDELRDMFADKPRRDLKLPEQIEAHIKAEAEARAKPIVEAAEKRHREAQARLSQRLEATEENLDQAKSALKEMEKRLEEAVRAHREEAVLRAKAQGEIAGHRAGAESARKALEEERRKTDERIAEMSKATSALTAALEAKAQKPEHVFDFADLVVKERDGFGKVKRLGLVKKP